MIEAMVPDSLFLNNRYFGKRRRRGTPPGSMPPAAHRANRDAAGKRPVSPLPPRGDPPPTRMVPAPHRRGATQRRIRTGSPAAGSVRWVRAGRRSFPPLPNGGGGPPPGDQAPPRGRRRERRRSPAVMVLVRVGKDKHVDPADSPAPDVGKNDLFSRVPAQAASAIDEHVPSSRKGNHVSRPSPDIQRGDRESMVGQRGVRDVYPRKESGHGRRHRRQRLPAPAAEPQGPEGSRAGADQRGC